MGELRGARIGGARSARHRNRPGLSRTASKATLGSGTGLGKPSRDWRASPGEKGRAAREWVSAGHGCIGRCPSSLLAGSVWLAAGKQARRRPRLGLTAAKSRRHLVTLERVRSWTCPWTWTDRSGQVQSRGICLGNVMLALYATPGHASRYRVSDLSRHLTKGIKHTPGHHCDVGSLSHNLVHV